MLNPMFSQAENSLFKKIQHILKEVEKSPEYLDVLTRG